MPSVHKTPNAGVMPFPPGYIEVDKMGKDHNSELLKWVEELKSTTDIE